MYRRGPPCLQSRIPHPPRSTQGGPPMSDPIHGGSAAQFRSPFRSLVLDPGLLFCHVLSAEHLAAAVAQEVGKTCDRIFTPVVTLCTFLAQVLSDDHSCRAAVARAPWSTGRRSACPTLPGTRPSTPSMATRSPGVASRSLGSSS